MSVSKDKSGTLRAQEHGHQPAICYGISAYESNAMKSNNPNSGVCLAETARTLDNNGGSPACNQGGMAIVQCYDARGNGDGDTAPTMTGDHQSRITDYTAIITGPDTVSTLQARDYKGVGRMDTVSRLTYSLQGSMIGRAEKNGPQGDGINEDKCFTLNSTDHHAVANAIVRRLTPLECERLQGYPLVREVKVTEMSKDEYIAWNIAEGKILVNVEEGKIYGTRGPGGVPLIKPKELVGSVVNGYRVVNIRNGTVKLQCRVHRIVWIAQHGIIPEGYVIDHINNDKQDNRISNLQVITTKANSTKARADGCYKVKEQAGQAKITNEVHDLIQYIYNTTDTTCKQLAERFGISKSRVSQIIHEEGWTDIGEWTDSKGKTRKCADSARYKALGNSIALPPWTYVLSRLNSYCVEHTMASLFDGIGGFPLIWERLNGKGSAVWASEVEEFPIAVTKTRFGQE